MVKIDSITERAHAKINLSLDVLGKRMDGYHDLRMIMQEIELFDTVTVEGIQRGIKIWCNDPKIPVGTSNTVYKAVKLLMDECKIQKGVKISIEKNIPVSAGLGGGSSDAAAAIRSVVRLFNLPKDEELYYKIALKTGADVPFFIKGGISLAEGIGERLSGLPSIEQMIILLVNPGFPVPTAWVYRNLDLASSMDHPDTDLLVDALRCNNISILAKNMKNVLEAVTIKEYSIIQKIKDQMLENGALGSMMSGSGPTVFGIYNSLELAQNALNKISKPGYKCYLTRTIGKER